MTEHSLPLEYCADAEMTASARLEGLLLTAVGVQSLRSFSNGWGSGLRPGFVVGVLGGFQRGSSNVEGASKQRPGGVAGCWRGV